MNYDVLGDLFRAIRDAANEANNHKLAHVASAAMAGELWARERICAALSGIDPTTPDYDVLKVFQP